VYGDYDFSDLTTLYGDLIKEGNDVYFARYGLGNEGYLYAAYDDIKDNFILDEVYYGCYSQCNIYKLELKDV
jgi:hypothetical protein